MLPLRLTVSGVLLVLVAATASAAEPRSINREVRTVEGWTVRVDVALLKGPEAEIGQKALRVLGHKLAEVAVLVPADRLKKLRTVTIVLDAHHPLRSMQYHPSAKWLKDHGYEPSLEKCVHIPRAGELAGRLPIDWQPMVVLHELAHAYHDQFLGFEEPRIKTAWLRAKESGKLDPVLHQSGDRRRHYALTNQMEFFAEMTESFFGTNDFHPFVRAELKQDFREVHDLLAEVWGIK